MELLPSLAVDWESNEEEGTYTFRLREGVVWHDGQPFTAEDVKFSFEQIISKFHVFGSSYFKDTTVEIVDPQTVVIKPGKFLPAAQLRLFATTETSIYPKHILEDEAENFLKSEYRTKPIGTGPFKFKSWIKGSQMELVRNENYWDKPKPYLERIIVRFLKDPASIIAGLQRGEIHYMFRGIPFEAINTLEASPNIKVFLHNRPPYRAALWINVKAPPLDDVNVRRAISYAIDREDIANKATFGISKPNQWMIDPQQVPPSPNAMVYEYDPDKANQILDEAGYEKGPDGFRFTIELMTRTGEPDEQLFAQLIRDQLAEVGIKVNIITVDFATYLAKQSKFDYQMATVKYWIDALWVYQLFHSDWIGKGPFTNNFQYSNPEVDELLNQWLVETDPAKQVELLQRVGEILSQDLPAIWLYEVIWPNVLNADFEGPDIPVGKFVFYDPLKDMYFKPIQKEEEAMTTTPMVTETATEVVERTVTVTTTVTAAGPGAVTTTVTVEKTVEAAAKVAGMDPSLFAAVVIVIGLLIAIAGIVAGRRARKP